LGPGVSLVSANVLHFALLREFRLLLARSVLLTIATFSG
jgi:hypothetical protein